MRSDRKLHLCYGAIIAAVGFFASALFTDNIWYSLISGFALSTLVGLGKEILDRIKPYGTRQFDKVDWFYTVAGGALTCGFIVVINVIAQWIG